MKKVTGSEDRFCYIPLSEYDCIMLPDKFIKYSDYNPRQSPPGLTVLHSDLSVVIRSSIGKLFVAVLKNFENHSITST